MAASRGAALYGLANDRSSTLMLSTVSPKSYIVGVQLPAELGDLVAYPERITTNFQNMKMCAHRFGLCVLWYFHYVVDIVCPLPSQGSVHPTKG